MILKREDLIPDIKRLTPEERPFPQKRKPGVRFPYIG